MEYTVPPNFMADKKPFSSPIKPERDPPSKVFWRDICYLHAVMNLKPKVIAEAITKKHGLGPTALLNTHVSDRITRLVKGAFLSPRKRKGLEENLASNEDGRKAAKRPECKRETVIVEICNTHYIYHPSSSLSINTFFVCGSDCLQSSFLHAFLFLLMHSS